MRWIVLLGIMGALATAVILTRIVPQEQGTFVASATAEHPRAQSIDHDEDLRSAALTAAWEAAAERTRLREATSTALVRGELTARQATEMFEDILTADPVVLACLQTSHPQDPTSSLAARQLIGFVGYHVRADAERAAEVLRELELLSWEATCTQ
jgi:hypothetical protein